MNMSMIKEIVASFGGSWYLKQHEVAKLIGCHRTKASVFIKEHSIPPHLIMGTNKYFIPDIIAVIEPQRWKEKPNPDRRMTRFREQA